MGTVPCVLVQGFAVVGGDAVSAAVQRGLVLQLCLALPPGELRIVGPVDGDLAWAEALPHRAAHSGTRLAVVAPGGRVPADADIAIARCRPGDPPPPQCAAVVTVGVLSVVNDSISPVDVPCSFTAYARK